METKLNDSLTGQVLAGRYEIQSKLGEGAMGSVYKALDRTLGRTNAVKVLRLEVSSNADARSRFLREAKLAAKIGHPNAVVVHDFGETESGVTFLAMEYIEGQSLRELLEKEGSLPPARVVNIVQQVAAALDAAHKLNIIHRDLKPDNIMVMAGDRVKVVDFGIAKALDGQEGLGTITQKGGMVGTPLYMSPEQVEGKPLDARSDVYSLALVTYEMLTGAFAFAGDSWQAQMAARLWKSPLPMSDAAPSVTVPASVEAVVQQALARRPEDRPASAGAFAKQLASAHTGRLDAQSVKDTLELIDSLLAVGSFELVLALVNEALETNPDSPELRTKKVEILIEQGSREKILEAIRIIVSVVDIQPDYGPSYYCIGRLKEYEGQVELAIASYKLCLDLKPDPQYACKAHTKLAMIYIKLFYDSKLSAEWLLNGIKIEAQAALATAPRKSLEVYPRLALATMYLDRQQYMLAREHLEKLMQDNAFRNDKERAGAYHQLALVAYSEKKYDEAIKAAECAVKLDPQNEDCQKLLRNFRQYKRT